MPSCSTSPPLSSLMHCYRTASHLKSLLKWNAILLCSLLYYKPSRLAQDKWRTWLRLIYFRLLCINLENGNLKVVYELNQENYLLRAEIGLWTSIGIGIGIRPIKINCLMPILVKMSIFDYELKKYTQRIYPCWGIENTIVELNNNIPNTLNFHSVSLWKFEAFLHFLRVYGMVIFMFPYFSCLTQNYHKLITALCSSLYFHSRLSTLTSNL